MRRALPLLLLIAASAPALAAGGGKGGTSGPAGIPYACSDGQALRVSYDGGGFRAKARLKHAGHSYDLATVATIDGLRYASMGEAGEAMVWRTDGMTGILSATPAGQAGTGEEREIARCTRVGWQGEEVAADDGHGDAHGSGHGGDKH